jgi:8-oxo-dGTP pyrophosphatase MutT (NUDIX family)
MPSDLHARLTDALVASAPGSSDFDLNPEITLPPGRKLRPAGVLVAVGQHEGRPQVLLTRRSSALKHHPGQVAFPGGKQDEGDCDLEATALREAHEEVRLPPDLPQILGRLPTHETVTGFLVTPVLALLPDRFTAVPEAGEVDEVFWVPLEHLADPGRYQVQRRRWRGAWRRYYAVPYGPYYIWGATARMLRGLAERLA